MEVKRAGRSEDNAALVVCAVTKRFGAKIAVREASLKLEKCKIHAIVGENCAGKSTLSSIAAGLCVPDSGHVEVFGQKLVPHAARAAIARGVGLVQQHFRLVDALTVLENAMLGVEPVRFGRLDRDAAREKFAAVQRELGSALPPEALVETLGVGDRQRLEIARVLFRDATIVLLDEPTAVLSPRDVAALYATLRRLADAGRAVAVVTHKMDEVLDFTDSVTVMRRGRVVATRVVDRDADRDEQRRAILHDAFHDSSDAPPVVERAADESEKVLLEVDGLEVEAGLQGVQLNVRAREIVGIAGVEGNGQHELTLVLAGLLPATGGSVRARRPVEVVHEDRHKQGLVVPASVADNALLGEYGRFSSWKGLDLRAMREEAMRRTRDGEVSPPEIDLPIAALSGGNQQKVVVARALARDPAAAERILVLAQPTRGVDIPAARQIHLRLVAAAETGAAVLVISADLDELRALCHRIVVMARGRIVGEARRDAQGRWDESATNERLGAKMIETEQGAA